MGASFGSSQQDDDLVSAINITPLVDVVLVLLVIFLMTAPVIYQSAIKVQLPTAQTGEKNQKSPLLFTLTQEGEVVWGNDRIEWSGISERLKALGPDLQEQTAMISADQRTPHGTVVRLMDILRQAGLSRFALNVDQATQ